jgi:hyperosmotically inducible periplasmic protein
MKNKMTISLCMAFCLGLTGATAVLTGCQSTRYSRSTGQYVDDKALSYRVKDALKDNAEYKLSNVDVKVFRANVQLSGFVATADQKNKAGEIAAHVQGVQGVENNITVKNELNQNQNQKG